MPDLHSPPPTPQSSAADAVRTGEADAQSPLQIRRLLAAASADGPADAAGERIAAALRSLGVWDCVALVTQTPDPRTARLEGLLSPTFGLSRNLQDQLLAGGLQSLRDRRSVLHRARDPDGWIHGCPLPLAENETPQALVGLSTAATGISPLAALSLECAVAELATAHVRHVAHRLETDLQRSAVVIELIESIAAASSPSKADRTLVHELSRTVGDCDVFLGRRRHAGAACRIEAASGESHDSRRDSTNADLAAVMDETLRCRRLCVLPASAPEQETGLLLHRQFLDQHDVAWIVSSPLDESDSGGAAVVIVGRDAGQADSAARFLHAAAAPLAAALDTLHRAQRGPLAWLRRRVGQLLAQKKRWFQAATVVMVGTVLAMPVPHRVECDCQLEPTVRQYVAAPFDATLEEVLVRPGDEVAQDQLLARLDGREIRWELAGVTADLQRAARERDGHLAEHDSGAARLAELEMERLRLQTRLLEHRMSHLEIRSPVDGLVISGDLDQAIGAPLTVGQSLFELAPLEQLVVELNIPQRDIQYAQSGQSIQFWLDSQPDQPRTGVIDRIHPRSEIREGENVFVAEVSVDNQGGWLRPGMSGTARIDVGECRLGWKLFHRVWEETCIWFGM